MTPTTEHSREASDVGEDILQRVAWSAGGASLCWLGLLYVGVVLGFSLGFGASPALAPAVTGVVLVTAWWFARRSGLATRHAVGAAAVTAAVIAGGLALAAVFTDLTWDGQWYHQTAVYEMAAG